MGKGQIFAFTLAVIGISGGVYLASIGNETSGLSTIIASIVALAGAFIIGRTQDKKQD